MSTFGGLMPEFPDIRVDYFRDIPGQRRPLKCFLSHVHSDHLSGLLDFKASFVYCSAATKELLIRLERSTNRVNFENGVLEVRSQDYKALEPRLKTIPLETPTRIELAPNNEIQVTLFDANHCTGAVMFLFEGDGKAVLYTGDIRSEPWFVNNLTRNPFLIEYTSGLKTFDCIYLDTSNSGPMNFPTKAEGLKELLQKVSKYPGDTIFHFSAWTFGYEEVWMALSRALKSQIHVDKYKLRLYESLRGKRSKDDNLLPSGPFLAHEGPVLTGYTCGNTPQEGCLTNDQTVRLHSCAKGVPCSAINDNDSVVWIRPIVTRRKNGDEISEIDIGGGGEDLLQRPQLELDSDAITQIISEINKIEGPRSQELKARFVAGIRSLGRTLPLESIEPFLEGSELSPDNLIKAIENAVSEKSAGIPETPGDGSLPKTITFPYSRHSSYPELCDLVRIFKPKDIYQCTVNEEFWDEDVSVRRLFGHECSAKIFRHDAEIRANRVMKAEKQRDLSSQQTQTTASSQSSQNYDITLSVELVKSAPSDRARPVEDVGMDSISDSQVRDNVLEIRRVLPHITLLAAKNALVACRGNIEQAMELLGSEGTREVTSESLAPVPVAPKKEIRRNSQGQLRFYDADGEISLPLTQNMSTPPPKVPICSASSDKTHSSPRQLAAKTPPKKILANSPGSESQNRRRRLILDELDLESAKRRRVHFEGLGSSPVAERSSAVSAKTEDKIGSQSPTLVENVSTVFAGSAGAPIPILSSPLWNGKSPAGGDNRMTPPAPLSFGPSRSIEVRLIDASENTSIVAGHVARTSNQVADKPENLFELESVGKSVHANTLGLEADNLPAQEPIVHHPNRPHYPTDENDEEIRYENPDYWRNSEEGDDIHFTFDPVDSIWRCQQCGHEIWSESIGFCTICKEEQGDPYYEIQDPSTPNSSGSEVNELSDSADADIASPEQETSPYLDCDSSAYDSQDEDLKFTEEYDIDSFIDDASEVEDEEDDKDDPSDEEIDWQARYQSLITSHAALSYSYHVLDEKYHDYKIAIEGDAYETSDDSDMDEMDENGMLVVDVAVPDPVVTELILSQAHGQSQEEEISEARVRDRVEAFQAASNENGREWGDISMLSTGDNHTFPEIEL